jgi:hypothetical protein
VYGWTESKKIAWAFMKQRSPNKYKVVKMTSEQIAEMFSETIMESSNQLDYFKIRSAKTGDEVVFFTTMEEMNEAETKIQRYFRELPHLIEHADGREEVVHLFVRLKNKFAEALDFIGFRPPEVELLYDRDDWVGDDGEGSIEGICDVIEQAYADKTIDEYRNGWDCNKRPLSASATSDVYTKLIISLESFIMILKEEM